MRVSSSTSAYARACATASLRPSRPTRRSQRSCSASSPETRRRILLDLVFVDLVLLFNGWRVHRALAARADFPRDLVPVLLKTKDLDVYTNVARNCRLREPAARRPSSAMCSIAGPAVEREEQQLWLPSLRLMHQPSSSSSSSAAAARQQEQNRAGNAALVPVAVAYAGARGATRRRRPRTTSPNGWTTLTSRCCNNRDADAASSLRLMRA